MKGSQLNKFVARLMFPHFDSVPQSYFLGHHRSGLEKMKSMLSSIDFVIECRDFRSPITSVNPMFEEALGEKSRLIVHTKYDLGGKGRKHRRTKEALRHFNRGMPIFYADIHHPNCLGPMVEHLKYYASGADKLVPYRGIVVGMPNVGKSSIINTLRNIGMHKAKAARTGNHPGITRKIGGPIKIVEREGSSSIYVLDTPGVFVPFLPDADRMLKLALCGCVKDGLIPPTILADYLLFHMNKHSPLYYEKWSEPTNDIIALLDSYARKNGFIIKGGLPNTELAAVNLVYKWRTGQLGKFLLDDVLGDSGQLQTAMENEASPVSLNKLRKVEKEWRTQAGKQRIAEKGYHD